MPTKSSLHSDDQLAEAEPNLERAIAAYDRDGEAGLARQMERIHPDGPTNGKKPVKADIVYGDRLPLDQK